MTRTRIQLTAIIGVVAFIAILAAIDAVPAGAATFQVTNTNDSGPGSFRQAVADANLAPGADTISFAVTGKITLTSGLILVNGGNLRIDGPGPGLLTVSGNGASGILDVTPSASLNLSGLTLADGSAGGGGGGAIQSNGGTVVIADTTFVGNSAFAGGAIENANGGTMTIAGSTFSGNTALPGGAISNLRSTLTITNSTFVGNSAVVGGAIYNLNIATVQVTNSTFSGNSASSQGNALDSTGGTSIAVQNSIFAGNGCTGAIQDGGGNLDWPASSCPGLNGDPRLGALADNGGPTDTMALGPGSAAIDAATSAGCPATDQRGVPRPFGAGCDIGAYEAAALDTTPPVITVPAGVVVDATSTAGAVVAYTVSGTDDVDGAVPVACVPPSGAIFAVGTTTVTCGASDAAGNNGTASFEVHVKGAREQLGDLLGDVTGVGPGSSLADKVRDAVAALRGGDIERACEKLAAFVNETNAQSGKTIAATRATGLVASAQRIRAVLSC
jgi:hypothetical protein